jgi:hypothetical protein
MVFEASILQSFNANAEPLLTVANEPWHVSMVPACFNEYGLDVFVKLQGYLCRNG